MSDLVQRLREGAYTDGLDDKLMKEAADEIERLRSGQSVKELQARLEKALEREGWTRCKDGSYEMLLQEANRQ